MNYLETGFYCPECGFFETIDLDEGERCDGCGCNESQHIPAAVIQINPNAI